MSGHQHGRSREIIRETLPPNAIIGYKGNALIGAASTAPYKRCNEIVRWRRN